MSGLFHVCQGTCLCATNPGDNYGRTGHGKVLYCYGEVEMFDIENIKNIADLFVFFFR